MMIAAFIAGLAIGLLAAEVDRRRCHRRAIRRIDGVLLQLNRGETP